MIVESHLWETVDGKLVTTGDPSAVTLKYPAGTELTEAEAKAAGLLKQAAKPRDKQVKKPTNKAG